MRSAEAVIAEGRRIITESSSLLAELLSNNASDSQAENLSEDEIVKKILEARQNSRKIISNGIIYTPFASLPKIDYQVIVVGDGNVGKTAYVEKLRTGKFETEYVPTIGADIHPLQFNTNLGLVGFTVFDCAGQERFSGIRSGVKDPWSFTSGYYTGAQGAIIVYDCHSQASLSGVNNWIQQVRANCGDIPIVVCGNKCDLEGNPVHREIKGTMQWSISVKNNHNIEKPFLWLVRKLKNDPNIEFR